jgi:hypothetical protein
MILDSSLNMAHSFDLSPSPFGNGYGIGMDDSEKIWVSNYNGNNINIYNIDGSIYDSILDPKLKYVSIIRHKLNGAMYIRTCNDPPVGSSWSIRIYNIHRQFVSLFPNDSAPLTDYITDIAFNNQGDLVVLNSRDSLITTYDSMGIIGRQYKANSRIIAVNTFSNGQYIIAQVGKRGLINILDNNFNLVSILESNGYITSRFSVDTKNRIIFVINNSINVFK